MNRFRLLAQWRLLVCCACFACAANGQRCGKERWSVKTGTDVGAAAVNLSAVTPSTISTLTSLAAPSPIPVDQRVAPTETSTWVVIGTLTSFKMEDGSTGDSDYHLVIADEHGLTMIVEIPFPGCVGANSPFLPGITAARKAFDARFSVTGSFQNVSVPVQVTGVGMFDFAHGQRGLARNGIELHPVLEILFGSESGTPITFLPAPGGAPGSPSPPPAPPALQSVQLIKDPSFEAGLQNSPWTASGKVINNSPAEPAHNGNWKAWLGGTGKTHTDRLSQKVAIPATAQSAMFSFWLRIATDETTTTQDLDTLAITVTDDQGNQLAIDDEEGDPYSNLDAMPFSKRTFDLSRFIGHTIDIVFTAKENRRKQTSFLIDDVLLIVK